MPLQRFFGPTLRAATWAFVSSAALTLPIQALAQSGPGTMAPVRSPGDPPPLPLPNPGVAPLPSSKAEEALFEKTFVAADRSNWGAARTAALNLSDPLKRDIIEWRYLFDKNSGATFRELDSFLATHSDWPRRRAFYALAEEAIPAEMTPSEIMQWFGTRTPATGTGKIRLGEALIAHGNQPQGTALIKLAWIDESFTPAEELQILQVHSPILSAQDHRDRLAYLLANDEKDAARRQLDRVEASVRRIAEARLRIKGSPGQALSTLDSLTPDARNDSGLLFEVARALRRRGADRDAWATLRQAPLEAGAPFADLWWNERHIMSRDALKASEFRLAYELVSHHGMIEGGSFADAEFLSGWIALRFLDEPESARRHFENLAAGVSYPISRARAQYWIGRASEAAGQTADAEAAYRKAAVDKATFYGQLALVRLGDGNVIEIPPHPQIDPATRARFMGDPMLRAMEILAKLNRRDLMRIFALHATDLGHGAAYENLLAERAAVLGDRALSVKIAKAASYQDIVLPAYLHPVIVLPTFPARKDGPEVALVLGLTRQESEFDEKVISHAGARGLMQLMPATARLTARRYGLSYSQSGLTNDPDYNMRVGMAHLADVLNEWNGSYILAIASYNAGANNVRRWIETFGDPRDPTLDAIDWIELIPFGETRNYVQRVLENTGVYRSRLAGGRHQVMIAADLDRGVFTRDGERRTGWHGENPLLRTASRAQGGRDLVPLPIPRPKDVSSAQ